MFMDFEDRRQNTESLVFNLFNFFYFQIINFSLQYITQLAVPNYTMKQYSKVLKTSNAGTNVQAQNLKLLVVGRIQTICVYFSRQFLTNFTCFKS